MKLAHLVEAGKSVKSWFNSYVNVQFTENKEFLELVQNGGDTSEYNVEISPGIGATTKVFDIPVKMQAVNDLKITDFDIRDVSLLPKAYFLNLVDCSVGAGFGKYLADNVEKADIRNTKMTREDVVEMLTTGRYFRYAFFSQTFDLIICRKDDGVMMIMGPGAGKDKPDPKDDFAIQDWIINTIDGKWFLD